MRKSLKQVNMHIHANRIAMDFDTDGHTDKNILKLIKNTECLEQLQVYYLQSLNKCNQNHDL